MSTVFVTGIDTDSGKTCAAGLLARYVLTTGRSVITQKLVQTGCSGMAADIIEHRRLMGTPCTQHDRDGTTCPYVLRFAASPHLAARLENQRIDPARLTQATRRLQSLYDVVIVEGVGGVSVPLTDELILLDYVAERGYPVVLVTSPRLGSINHTLMSIELLSARKLRIIGLVYNRFHDAEPAIVRDSRRVFAASLHRAGHAGAVIIDMPRVDHDCPTPDVDFSPLFSTAVGVSLDCAWTPSLARGEATAGHVPVGP